MIRNIFVVAFLLTAISAVGQVVYPYPVQRIKLRMDNTPAQMVYMDILPSANSNGKTIVLLHGKNFNGYYWKTVIPLLTKEGYRVIVPDQIGWGRSDKPDIHYSFHLLATYESYKKYQQSYYPVWKPEYEQYVKAQAELLDHPDFNRIARMNATDTVCNIASSLIQIKRPLR